MGPVIDERMIWGGDALAVTELEVDEWAANELGCRAVRIERERSQFANPDKHEGWKVMKVTGLLDKFLQQDTHRKCL
jgi:hypothetical protein